MTHEIILEQKDWSAVVERLNDALAKHYDWGHVSAKWKDEALRILQESETHKAEEETHKLEPEHANCCQGCQWELNELLRLVIDHHEIGDVTPEQLMGYIERNYPKQWKKYTPVNQPAEPSLIEKLIKMRDSCDYEPDKETFDITITKLMEAEGLIPR